MKNRQDVPRYYDHRILFTSTILDPVLWSILASYKYLKTVGTLDIELRSHEKKFGDPTANILKVVNI